MLRLALKLSLPSLLSLLSLAILLPAVLFAVAAAQESPPAAAEFPAELTNWEPYSGNPLLTGTGADTWDRKIRERGYILREGDLWRLWYTGYNTPRADTMSLGYATSADGIHWKRTSDRPLFDQSWVEDMCVVKHDGTYFMFAEGLHDIAHLLTSPDGIRWEDHGSLDIRTTNGQPLSPGPYGTPTVWIEGDTWYLFYERGDRGIWLAKSTDRKRWTNAQDDPVIACGPEPYDRRAVALNQVIRYRGRYYGVYHANEDPQWKGPWTTCLAASDDLVHWNKFPGNPIIRSNDSSGILVDDGHGLRLYTMHPEVKLWVGKKKP